MTAEEVLDELKARVQARRFELEQIERTHGSEPSGKRRIVPLDYPSAGAKMSMCDEVIQMIEELKKEATQ